ncbi:MAG TPA: WYL domain-containing protein [Nitrospiraceae bacterium]|nr:WYL domain-containing protein [Nitrospiraceae bacterium]
MDLQQRVLLAIQERRLVTLDYDAKGERIVEPYALCESSLGELLVVGYQRSGYSESGRPSGWRTFQLKRLTGLSLGAEIFSRRADFNPGNNRRFKTVIAEV